MIVVLALPGKRSWRRAAPWVVAGRLLAVWWERLEGEVGTVQGSTAAAAAAAQCSPGTAGKGGRERESKYSSTAEGKHLAKLAANSV